jgi:hypothetical protein
LKYPEREEKAGTKHGKGRKARRKGTDEVARGVIVT